MKQIFSLMLALAMSGGAVAQSIDQVSTVDGGFVFNVGSASAMAQVFTAGLQGQLVQAEVEISNFDDSPTENMTLSIVRAPGGVPSTAPGDELFSTTILADDVSPARTSVLVTGIAIFVFEGDQLAIVLDAPEDPDSGFNSWSIYAQGGDPYTRGDAFRFGGSNQEADIGFRTWVDESVLPHAAPVPTLSMASLMVMSLVFALAALVALRQRRSAV